MSKYAVMPSADYKNICDSVREKTGGTDVIKSGEMAEKINEVYDAGKQAEYDKFWDSFQNNGNPKNYYYAFAYYVWNDENYNPKYDIIANDDRTATMSMFYGSSITDTKVAIYANETIQAAFYNCKNLKRISKLVLSETTTISTAFYSATALEDVTIEGTIGRACDLGSCGKLNKKSIINIISALSDTTSDVAATFNETAVNNAFETAEDSADGSTSEEWLALINTKPNWTIVI